MKFKKGDKATHEEFGDVVIHEGDNTDGFIKIKDSRGFVYLVKESRLKGINPKIKKSDLLARIEALEDIVNPDEAEQPEQQINPVPIEGEVYWVRDNDVIDRNWRIKIATKAGGFSSLSYGLSCLTYDQWKPYVKGVKP